MSDESEALVNAKSHWEGDGSMEIAAAAGHLTNARGWSNIRDPFWEGHARELMKAAQPVPHDLFHGVAASHSYKVGDQIDVPLRAASKDRKMAEAFANPSGSEPDQTIYRFEPGARATRIHDLEHVVTGRYEVTHAEPGEVHLRHVQPLQVTKQAASQYTQGLPEYLPPTPKPLSDTEALHARLLAEHLEAYHPHLVGHPQADMMHRAEHTLYGDSGIGGADRPGQEGLWNHEHHPLVDPSRPKRDRIAEWDRQQGQHLSAQAGLDDDDYRMQHRPPGRDGTPIHDLTHNFPEDIYTHPHYYSDMSEPSNVEAHHVIRRVRGNPDARVKIYRSLPAEHAHQGFRPGDWVSTSKDYARNHGKHHSDPKRDWPVISTTVRADDLHTDGDDFREYGYNGAESKPGSVAYKGGYHQEIADRADGGVGKVLRKAPSPIKGFDVRHEDGSFDDFMAGRGGVTAYDREGNYAGHLRWDSDGVFSHHIEPQHAEVAEHLTKKMRSFMPKTSATKKSGSKAAEEAYDGSHEREHAHQGRQGRPGLGLPGGGRRGAAQGGLERGADLARGAAQGPAGDPGLNVTWHPKAAKDLKGLDRGVQKQILSTIDGITSGDPATMAQSHALTGPLKGWTATKASRGHRIIHRPNDAGGIHIGYVGLHEYDKAIQRLTSFTLLEY